jgi:lipid-binding SYLF domain-containing protein
MAQTLPPHGQLGRRTLLTISAALVAQLAMPAMAHAAGAKALTADGRAQLQALYSKSNKAAELGKRSKAVLVFPNIVKAGAVVGGMGGEGVLFVNGKANSFYRISAASIGYQLGVQKFGYALFFVSDSAVNHLRTSSGWAVGTGPSLVVVDEGFAKSMNTTTLKDDIYAMSFNQRGLMAGAGLEGSKVTQITPDP